MNKKYRHDKKTPVQMALKPVENPDVFNYLIKSKKEFFYPRHLVYSDGSTLHPERHN